MATRAAARPLQRHVKARVRAATLPASCTTSGDTTIQCRTRGPDRSAKIDLYGYSRLPEPKPRGRPVADDLSDWRVTDDWPEDVPVTPEEVDVFEAWFGDILEELFGPEGPDRA